MKFLDKIFRTTLYDYENLYCNNQTIVDGDISENVVDLGTHLQRHGSKRTILVSITETFVGITGLHVQLASDEDPAFGSPQEDVRVITGEFEAGTSFDIPLPKNVGRYTRLVFNTTGTATAGAVTAGIALDAEAQY